MSMETLRATYETNFFGVFTVIQHLLPLLRKSALVPGSSTSPRRWDRLACRATRKSPTVRQSSILAYNSSKTALNGLTLAFAKELAGEQDVRQLGLPRLGQDRHGYGRRPAHGRTGCGHRREVGDDGDPPTSASSSTTAVEILMVVVDLHRLLPAYIGSVDGSTSASVISRMTRHGFPRRTRRPGCPS